MPRLSSVDRMCGGFDVYFKLGVMFTASQSNEKTVDTTSVEHHMLALP